MRFKVQFSVQSSMKTLVPLHLRIPSPWTVIILLQGFFNPKLAQDQRVRGYGKQNKDEKTAMVVMVTKKLYGSNYGCGIVDFSNLLFERGSSFLTNCASTNMRHSSSRLKSASPFTPPLTFLVSMTVLVDLGGNSIDSRKFTPEYSRELCQESSPVH